MESKWNLIRKNAQKVNEKQEKVQHRSPKRKKFSDFAASEESLAGTRESVSRTMLSLESEEI